MSDILQALEEIQELLGATVAKKKLTEEQRARFKASRERALAHAQQLRELAERGQRELDAKRAQTE